MFNDNFKLKVALHPQIEDSSYYITITITRDANISQLLWEFDLPT